MAKGQVKQGTIEWKEARKGYITSSCMYKLMTEPKSKLDKDSGNLSETAKGYVLDVIASEVSLPFELNNDAVTWGKSQEALGRHFYTLRTGNDVTEDGFIVSDIEGYGGSPDGVVLDKNGIIEIKAPFSPSKHLEYCLITAVEDIPSEYYWQMVSNMYVLNKDWCDFISFDPRIDHEIGLFIYRIEREKEKVNEDKMIGKVRKALEYKKELMTKLKLITP